MSETNIDSAVDRALAILREAGATGVIAYLAADAQSWTVAACAPEALADGGKALLADASNVLCKQSKKIGG